MSSHRAIRNGETVRNSPKKLTPPRPIHPFPARMAASIPWSELQSSKKLRVLDPMVGSGTTLAVARTLGHDVFGTDLDPLATLLTKTWCSRVSEASVRLATETVVKRAAQRARHLRGLNSYPENADSETQAFVRYWFDLSNRRQLRALSDEIRTVKSSRVQRVLWVAFSRLIITKESGASRARDLSHSRPHRVDKVPRRAIPNFRNEVEKVLTALRSQQRLSPSKVVVRAGDARNLEGIEDESIDIAITSPPYLNAIDYLRTSKFTLVWMGYKIAAVRETRRTSIGSEVSSGVSESEFQTIYQRMGRTKLLPKRTRLILARYIRDMAQVMDEIVRVLIPGGRAILVVADCAIRGVRVRNSIGIQALAELKGLSAEKHTRRTILATRRYLPPPGAANGLANRMRTETVLRFRKPR